MRFVLALAVDNLDHMPLEGIKKALEMYSSNTSMYLIFATQSGQQFASKIYPQMNSLVISLELTL